ncbi:RTA1 like protein-domain-containing protein [Staphylotrichum tortipilum]|uniref:RTA1 like protein-domain-containing protein n=1 Tax=Staphylotrichum tortipilum TaxID=2831512 RepID=A0AAN6RTI5_9PEZI|nr:RTA1 like protein-domain-containing protein [Staphylotrichum longicolle]
MAGGSQSYEGGFKLYRYDPNLAANIVFIVLFAALTAGHIFLLIRKRVWYFIPFVLGCTFETLGYVGRAIASKEAPDFTLSVYIMQTLLILLGPALLAASIYMILARLIRLLGAEKYALIRTTWMTKIFVTGDVISFMAQGAGGGLMAKAKTHSEQKLGENVILAGLAIQVLFFGFFIVTTVTFDLRMRADPTPTSLSVTSPWRTHVIALYACSVLIMVRSIFRMIEFGMGNDSVLMQSEAYLLGLDGALMLIVAALLLWSHPSRALRGYKEMTAASVGGDGGESGRNTAEGFQMLPGGGREETGVKTPRGGYAASSDGTGAGGSYGYEMAARPGRYSASYER